MLLINGKKYIDFMTYLSIIFYHKKHDEKSSVCLIDAVCHMAAHSIVHPTIQDNYIYIKNNIKWMI